MDGIFSPLTTLYCTARIHVLSYANCFVQLPWTYHSVVVYHFVSINLLCVVFLQGTCGDRFCYVYPWQCECKTAIPILIRSVCAQRYLYLHNICVLSYLNAYCVCFSLLHGRSLNKDSSEEHTIHFINVFLLVWGGAAVVTVNAQLLRGKV